MTFIKACLQGRAQPTDIDQFIQDWHSSREGTEEELHEYLGMEWTEYQLWSTTPAVLPFVLNAHRHNTSLQEELANNRIAIAAQFTSTAELAKVEAWLHSAEQH